MVKKSKKVKLNRKTILYVLLAVLTVSFALGSWALYNVTQRPHESSTYSLGNKLEYLGKQDFGCEGLCSSLPYSLYFYATDMDSSEIKRYFTKASYTDTPPDGGGSSSYAYDKFVYSMKEKTFSITYYHPSDTKTILTEKQLPASTKNYIISITSSDYELAKKSI